jgi:hypothetical protein
MIQKKSKPPITKRRFANPWGELDYLCKKLRYWLYTRKQKTKAKRYLDRLERVLHDLPENDLAIIREEGFALLFELKGKIGESIAHRKREIQLMERLHKEAKSPTVAERTRAYMLRDRDTAALQERRALLVALEKAKAKPGEGVTRR